ncbi:MAG: MGMT family protein, partial [Bacillota bacterium]|nr:MGMT family protein [Bacillota bacterium]
MSYYRHDTVHGPVGIETDGHEILAIKVGDTRPTTDPVAPLAVEAARQIDEFYAGKRKRLDLPFTIEGTEFQKRVVIAVTRIPYGETRSYAEIARAAGHPNAFRAVGSVMAA